MAARAGVHTHEEWKGMPSRWPGREPVVFNRLGVSPKVPPQCWPTGNNGSSNCWKTSVGEQWFTAAPSFELLKERRCYRQRRPPWKTN